MTDEERKVYNKEYYQKNSKKIKEYRKERYQKNKEMIKEGVKKYYEQNRERCYQQNNQRMKIKNDVSRLTAHNHHQLWDPEQDEILIKLYHRGLTHKEIADKLSRTNQSISSRLKNLRKLGKLQ